MRGSTSSRMTFLCSFFTFIPPANVHRGGAPSVREVNLRLVLHVPFDLFPLSVVRANFLASAANGQNFSKEASPSSLPNAREESSLCRPGVPFF